MENGACVGCGAEEIEINDDGYCADCAELEGNEKGDDMNETEEEN